MNHPEGKSKIKSCLYLFLFLIYVIIFSYYFTCLRCTKPQYERATLVQLTNGSAWKPYQYRALIPWTVRIISSKFYGNYLIYFYRYTEFIFIFFLIMVYRYLLSFLFNTRHLSYFLAFSLFLALPLFYLLPTIYPFYFPSDIPSVFFFTVGLIALYKQNWKLYYPVFIIATFNRETSCFLTMLYVIIYFSKKNNREVILHGAIQAAIWLSIKIFLFELYKGNVGVGILENHFSANLEYLSTLKNYPYLLSMFLFIGLPTIFSSLIKDTFFRRSVWIIIPFFAGMMIVANIYELRIYGELIPIYLTAFLIILRELFSRILTKKQLIPSGPIYSKT